MITAIELFFAFGTFGFYLALSVLWVLATCLEETEQGFKALVVVALTVYYLSFVKLIDLVFLTHHPIWILLGFLAWFFVGGISLFFKWPGYIQDYLDYAKSYCHSEELIRSDFPNTEKEFERLVTWATYWPWSIAWFLLRHPARRAAVFVVNTVSGQLDKIAISMRDRALARMKK